MKLYIAGHTGLIGSALMRRYSGEKEVTLVLAKRSELDLTDQKGVENFLRKSKPDAMIIAAGRVGGIQANSKYPAEFIFENLMMETNLIHGAWKAGVQKVLNFGSSCLYPKYSSQPMKPEVLMTGKMEETNEPYGAAKLAGMFLASSYSRQYGVSYINAIPANVYGPGDSFDLEQCHVLSALVRKFHEAKIRKESSVTLWGSGEVTRDFLFVDDFAEACALLLEKYRGEGPINIGAEVPTTIRNLAEKIAKAVGFEGEILWDRSKPDGAPMRLLDATEIKHLGWQAKTTLSTGIETTYRWFLETLKL